MTYKFKCKDVGMNCKFEFKGANSEDEALTLAKTHAEKAHGVKELSPDLADKVKKAIKKSNYSTFNFSLLTLLFSNSSE
jgi:Predicted small metal-binding protein